MLPAQQPDVTCKTVWNTITSKNRSHIPYQLLQWLIKYLSDHLNTSTGPSIIPLLEFTYYNLQWKSQASCKATGAWNSRRSRFSLVSCLKGQISEQTLLLEIKILWEIKSAAFQGTVGKSFSFLPSCPMWYQSFDGDRRTDLSCTGAYVRRTETRELLTWGRWHSSERLAKQLCSALWEQGDPTGKTLQWPSIWRQPSLAPEPCWLLLCSRWKQYPRALKVRQPNFTRCTSWKVSWSKTWHFLFKKERGIGFSSLS